MNESAEIKEFDIFGHKVRFKPDASEGFSAEDVINLLKKTGENIDPDSKLTSSKKLLLVALKIASEKIKIEEKFRGDLVDLEVNIDEIICHLQEISNEAPDISSSLN